jgi:hypothetical protein
MEENLLIWSVHGTFRINEPLHDATYGKKLEFLFQANKETIWDPDEQSLWRWCSLIF